MNKLYSKVEKLGRLNPFTNVYGIGRSIMALSILLTLLFNNSSIFFPLHHLEALEKTKDSFAFMSFFLIFGIKYVWLAQWFGILVMVAVISGYFPQVTVLLHWWVAFSLFKTTPYIDGGDQIVNNLTLLIIPIGLFDPRKNHWIRANKGRNAYINIFCYSIFYVISLQMAFLYFDAGLEKTQQIEWQNGTACYYWFNNNVFGASGFIKTILNKLLVYPVFVILFTWGTLLLEIILAGAIFMEYYKRKKLLFWGVFFHFFIFLFHGLTSFALGMMGGLVLYLLPFYQYVEVSIPAPKKRIVVGI